MALQNKVFGSPVERRKKKEVCLKVNSKLYLHLSKQEESLFVAKTSFSTKMALRPVANPVPASSEPNLLKVAIPAAMSCSWKYRHQGL